MSDQTTSQRFRSAALVFGFVILVSGLIGSAWKVNSAIDWARATMKEAKHD